MLLAPQHSVKHRTLGMPTPGMIQQSNLAIERRGMACRGSPGCPAAAVVAALQLRVLSACVMPIRLLRVLQSSVSETPRQRRRRRLTAQQAIQTDPGADGIAVGLDGHIYSDTAITEAVAQVGELGPLNPKVAVCHFPAPDRSPDTVSPWQPLLHRHVLL